MNHETHERHEKNIETRKKDFFFYFGELESEECFCGRAKKSGKSFCYRCFTELPYEMRRALYKRIGDGYEAAYDAAVDYLDALGR